MPAMLVADPRTLLRTGLSPEDLALAIAVGFVLGCLPLWGISSMLCLGVAASLRLNLMAMQAANWLALPLQILLLFPFRRFGEWVLRSQASTHGFELRFPSYTSFPPVLSAVGALLVHALAGWMLLALPAALVLRFVLAALFRRLQLSVLH
jgi:uncharacterized protein (DUF2062 family)